jgi:hypothetical protein
MAIVEIFFVFQSHKSHEHVLGAENPEFGQPNQTIQFVFRDGYHPRGLKLRSYGMQFIRLFYIEDNKDLR